MKEGTTDITPYSGIERVADEARARAMAEAALIQIARTLPNSLLADDEISAIVQVLEGYFCARFDTIKAPNFVPDLFP